MISLLVPACRPDVGEDEVQAVVEVLRSGWPTQGRVTEQFEALLAKYFCSEVVAMNSGSSALLCALLAHGIGPGDKVIVPAFGFIAPASVSKILGANILLADVDEETFNISPESVEKIVRKEDVEAVILIDEAGMPPDLDVFEELAGQYGFALIEDACEALGAEYEDQLVGSLDHTTVFSFQITKQVTTVEGGCVVTRDPEVAEKCRMIRNYGRSESGGYIHQVLGTNLRTTDIQSAMGIIQFGKLESYLQRREEIATEYRAGIKGFGFQIVPDYVTRHPYMMFFAVAEDRTERDWYIARLNEKGIDARKSFMPIHMQPCFPEFHRAKYRNAENVFGRCFSLPISNGMTLDDVSTVLESFS